MLQPDPVLWRAIEERRMLRLLYHGRLRIVEPQDHGILNGSVQLLAYQVGGSSSRPLPNWILMKADQIADLELLDQNFPGGRPTAAGKHLKWNTLFIRVKPATDPRLSTKYDVSGTSECIRVLVEHGAHWNPEDKTELNSVRKALYQCEPVVVVDLMKLLARNKACPEETLEQLLDAPRMREHLSTLGMRLIGTSPKRLSSRT